MFGWKRLVDGFHSATEMSKAGVSDEKCVDKVTEVITNFGRTNFIAGCLALAATTGTVAGLIGLEVHKKIKKKKKIKELLEGSDE